MRTVRLKSRAGIGPQSIAIEAEPVTGARRRGDGSAEEAVRLLIEWMDRPSGGAVEDEVNRRACWRPHACVRTAVLHLDPGGQAAVHNDAPPARFTAAHAAVRARSGARSPP